MPSCAAWGEFGMNCSMISRRVGTPGPYWSEPQDRRADRGDVARVDPVLLLELVLEPVVEQGEQQLLAAPAELAGRVVQRLQREVLEGAGDPADVGEVAVVARILDLDLVLGRARVGDSVATHRDQCRHEGRRQRGPGEGGGCP